MRNQHDRDAAATIAGLFAVANIQDDAGRRREAHRQALLVEFSASPIGLKEIYTTNDYPLDGCTVVLNFSGDKYQMSTYAPGFVPHGSHGKMESYAHRKIGSAGIAVDAWVKGRDTRGVLSEMSRAENLIPSTYCAAAWRNTTPVDATSGEIGIGFNLADGGVVRLRLTPASAKAASESLANYLADHFAASKSAASSDTPSVDVSVSNDSICEPTISFRKIKDKDFSVEIRPRVGEVVYVLAESGPLASGLRIDQIGSSTIIAHPVKEIRQR